MEHIDFALVNWSRAQFALTAMVHWLFVPLTLGLAFILAFMETMYYKTRDPEWKTITKFWMKLFGINFAIGVATGIILEFEFGTNWSNYSWFVGDIFGAPLAIEGIMAFFLESTFIAVMFFGWNKVSPRFHLIATWLTAVGANLSALWILVANAWMQNPQGMRFNPDTARNEMVNFWDVLLSETAANKFIHTTTSGFVLASVFVIGISAWFLLKKRHQLLARRSMIVAGTFGVIASVILIGSGDTSSRELSRIQPMKFAAMEAHLDGGSDVPLIAIGVLGPNTSQPITPDTQEDMIFKIEVPALLSLMTHGDRTTYIPGIKDLLYGNEAQGVMPAVEKIKLGHEAQQTLRAYKDAQKAGDTLQALQLRSHFEDPAWMQSTFKYFGYGAYYDENPEVLKQNVTHLVPNISLTFYAFHIMVGLGFWFLMLFALVLWFIYRQQIDRTRWLLWAAVWTIPLAYLASESGWVVAEVGRQPWVIQDLMSTMTAVSHIDTTSVMITFWLFAITFAALVTAEIRIMLKQIKNGPNDGGH